MSHLLFLFSLKLTNKIFSLWHKNWERTEVDPLYSSIRNGNGIGCWVGYFQSSNGRRIYKVSDRMKNGKEVEMSELDGILWFMYINMLSIFETE